MKRIAGIASVIMVLAAYSGLARAETKSGLYSIQAFDAPSTHPYYDWGREQLDRRPPEPLLSNRLPGCPVSAKSTG